MTGMLPVPVVFVAFVKNKTPRPHWAYLRRRPNYFPFIFLSAIRPKAIADFQLLADFAVAVKIAD